MQTPEVRPLPVGEILEASIRLYLNHFLTLIKAVAVVIVPVTLVGLVITLALIPDDAILSNDRIVVRAGDEFWNLVIGLVVVGLISGLGTLIATGASFKALADAYLGRRPEAGASLRLAAERLPSLLWVSVLTAIVIVLGFLALIIPGIYLAVALSVVVPVLLVEDKRGAAALRRSRELIKGRWWPVFGTVLLGVGLIPGIIGAVIGFFFDVLLVNSMESVTGNLVTSWIGDAVAAIITTPLSAAVLMVLYFDLRARKEGFTPQHLSAGSEPGPTL